MFLLWGTSGDFLKEIPRTPKELYTSLDKMDSNSSAVL